AIARPPAIYGPGDREMLPVFQAAQASQILPVPSETARIGMIHVEDATRQIAALAARDGVGGGAVALSDGRP
ncbi:epimerase, partial [Salmonella enterica]